MRENYCHTDGPKMLRARWWRDLPPGQVIARHDFKVMESCKGLPWDSDQVVLSVKDMVGMRIDSLAGLKTGVKKGEPVKLSDADLGDITAALTVESSSTTQMYCSTGYYPGQEKKEEEQLHTVRYDGEGDG